MCQVSILTKFQLSGIKHSLTSFHLTGNNPFQQGADIAPYAIVGIHTALTHAMASTQKAIAFMFQSRVWTLLTPRVSLSLLATIS